MERFGLLAALLMAGHCCAQNPDSKRIDHWYFGDGAGLDFSGGAPVADTSGSMYVWKGSTTMSDREGNLLFYSDGRHVWNAQHDTMPNGFIDGIWPNIHPQQATIAVPKPGNDDLYYIFTNDGSFGASPFLNGIQYHIVDMTLDGGLGDVVQANIPLYFPSNQQMCAVRHGNTCDYWLISHTYDTNEYLAFHISENGVDHTPVVSPTGLDYSQVLQNNSVYTAGQLLKASVQGDKLASIVHWRYQNSGRDDEIQLSHFDNASGSVFNTFSIVLDSVWGGCSFSPNGQLFYADYGHNITKLDQFDLLLWESVNVNNSRVNLRNKLFNFGGDLRVGPDAKIYGSTEWGWVFGIDSLPVIHFPDVLGLGCMVDDWGVGLSGRYSRFIMTNYIDNFAAANAPDHGCGVGISERLTSGLVKAWFSGTSLLIEHPLSEEVTVLLFDALGRACPYGALEHHGDRTVMRVAHLASGTYYLHVIVSGQRLLFQTLIKP